MRKVLFIALLFFSCQHEEFHKKSPYDFASQQQLSYLSKFSAFKDSLKLPVKNNSVTQLNSNYQRWAIQYWKGNPQINKWLLKVKDINSDDTAIFFTLVDPSVPISLVSSARTNSVNYNTIQKAGENAFVLATGSIKSSPSFQNANDSIFSGVYLEAVFDKIVDMKDSVQ